MRNLLDWKYLITLLVAIAAAAIPFYLWKADLNANSLKFRLLSQTSLQPKEVTGVAGFKISVDGQELKAPYLSVIELSNDGEKPVPAANFEGALELNLEGDTKILRADVTSTSPKDIRASVKFEPRSVQIQPLLLNPQDSLTLAVITDGTAPTFLPRARISGIRDISIENLSKPQISKTTQIVGLCFSVLAFLGAWILSKGVFPNKQSLLLSYKGATLVSLLLIFSGIGTIVLTSPFTGNTPEYYLIIVLLNIAAALLAMILDWAQKAPPPTPEK